MTISTETICSAKPNYHNNRIVDQTISAGLPSLIPPLVNLVTQYIFPEPKEWVTEWTGPHGYEVLYDAVTQAKTPLSRGPVSLVMQYLKKNDIFGLAELETAAGKTEAETEGNREKGKQELTKLLGNYNMEQSFPIEIDDQMQAPLSQHFDARTLRRTFTPNIDKVTDVYSLYWGPLRMTPNIIEQIAKKHGQKFHQDCSQTALQEHGDTPASIDRWIQFPNIVFGEDEPTQRLEEPAPHGIIPNGFECPHFQDVVFCVFTRYVCTKERIMRRTFTQCQEKATLYGARYALNAGHFEDDGLRVHGETEVNRVYTGVTPVRKLS